MLKTNIIENNRIKLNRIENMGENIQKRIESHRNWQNCIKIKGFHRRELSVFGQN